MASGSSQMPAWGTSTTTGDSPDVGSTISNGSTLVRDVEDGLAGQLALELLDLDLVLTASAGGEDHGRCALRLARGQLADDPLDDHLARGGLDLEDERGLG